MPGTEGEPLRIDTASGRSTKLTDINPELHDLALGDLKAPPGNHLEALKGDRTGQYSIRVNDQFRICFRWTSDGPKDVEFTDYH